MPTEPLYVINLWVYGSDRFTDPPTDVLGPFTEAECQLIGATLTCENDRRRLSRRVPEWATT